MKEDLISIIVPVYNAGKYLHRCIESVVRQSHKNIELILVNDGSTDNSGRICDKYALGDKRITVIHTQNRGPAAARNIGIERSRGSFIFFVDTDDFVEGGAFRLLIENYNQHRADITAGDFKRIQNNNYFDSGHNYFFSNSKLLSKQDIIDYTRCYLNKPYKFILFVHCWGRLYKASIIKNNNISFNTELHNFEDVAFNFRYLSYANNVFFLKEIVYNYLIEDNDISQSLRIGDSTKYFAKYKQAFESVSNFLKASNAPVNIRKEVGHLYISCMLIMLIRSCGQINNSNKRQIRRLIHETINDPDLRDRLRFYSPSKGDSRILPVLIRLKLVLPIILVCRYKYKAHRKKRAAVK